MKSQAQFCLFLFFIAVFLFKSNGQNVTGQLMQDFPQWINDKFKGPHPDARIVGNGLFTHVAPLTEKYSATNKQFAGTLDGRLYLRKQGTDSLLFIGEPAPNNYWSMDNALWSPNGKYLVAKQVNDSDVAEIELQGPKAKATSKRKYSRAGEAIPIHRFYILNIESGENTPISVDKHLPYVHLLHWSSDSNKLYFLMADRLLKEVYLKTMDIGNDKETVLLTETSDTYLIGLNLLQGYSNRLIESKQVVFFEGRSQFSWMSDRSGFNQIYLYNEAGSLVRPLTNFSENGIVLSIHEIDYQNGWIYFKANADPAKPYEVQLFRTHIDKPLIEKVTDTPGILDAFFQESKDTLWVFRSQLPETLRLDRYSVNGNYIDTPWQANPSLTAKNPIRHEYEWVTANDGITPLQTFILKPTDFDPNLRYPVVEYIYGAPFDNVVVRDLLDNWLWDMNRLAQAGFIVVFVDGRGTADRGKEFRDFSYGKFGQVELEDHISAIQQVGKKRPYMDLNRVGIFGHSWGGHFALRALLEAPEFYKAGHINAAAIDPHNFRIAIEPFMGCLPKECPENYKMSMLTDKLDRLKAPLMIVHGSNDDDVPIDDAYGLVSALKSSNYSNYELVVYDGADHIIMRNREWLPQMINFFITGLKE
ncbi:dipeptidyl aminopeptidase/acylaminoacyl peptidase [Ulvibacter sp. MAR_2010_11]|uniref:S9 family peptidase n=1 Tax=Ulvibacter sp. MAR_2010_11 TaxID=1250229 RepID=UPI000C2BBA1B|nr:alpha/beta fold hydrolase [Ulvibacter sp. MAR_2010_11]PKA84409.1 dipeptidyl aminopeptidase/acylaminoacyl peptidase [Ulvibacter sp. MAR_2010_11]